MAVLHTDDVTGNEYRDAIAALLPKHGGCVNLDVPFPVALKGDYVAEVQKLVAAHPQCATLVALPDSGAALLREFASQKAADTTHDWSTFAWFGTTTLHSPDFLFDARVDKSKADPNVADGVLGGDDDGAPPTSEYGDFRFAWSQAFGADPPLLSAYAYDALAVVALAIEKAASVHDRPKIRDALYDVARDGDHVPAFGPATLGDALRSARRGLRINYQGASGALEFDDFGVVQDPTLIWSVAKGDFGPTLIRYTEAQTSVVDDLKAPRACAP
jgi:ABC-type branched-subunit amino acid transport system substrate-binding protein